LTILQIHNHADQTRSDLLKLNKINILPQISYAILLYTLPTTCAEVKNAWICTSTPPVTLHGVVLN